MSLQPLENKALSRGIIGKSAPLLAEITIRKSQVQNFGLDHGAGHPILFALAHGALRWTKRGWWDLDCCQNGRKHRTRFLPEKSLRRGCPICSREEKVVDRRQTLSLSRAIEPSKLMVPQGEVP